MDLIKSVEIDNEDRLHIITKKVSFSMIYRTATEIHWNPEKHSLYSPKPRDWSYKMWYDYILKITEEKCNCRLECSEDTNWINIPMELKEELLNK